MMTKPYPTGEFAVGTKTFTIYNTRKEVLDTRGESMRHVCARIYYPTLKENTNGLKKAISMSRNEAKGIAKAFKIPLNYDKMEKNGGNLSEAYVDAPFIEGMKFPLIVFNHGYFSYPEGNSFLLLDLASHGYVVLTVGHPRESTSADFDNGTFEMLDTSLSKKMYSPFLRGIIAAYKLTSWY